MRTFSFKANSVTLAYQMLSRDENRVLSESVENMVAALNRACQLASDLPDPSLSLASRHYAGTPGRPRFEFDPHFLEFALEVRGPKEIAEVFGCSPRTVRRRALEHQLLQHGQTPFQDVLQNDGTVVHVRHGVIRHTRMSDISDQQLDNVVRQILRDFPDFGRRMIDGRLRAQGVRVSRARIIASYGRVHGPPAAFSRRRITRRPYWVGGVNSIWHHDGHHSMYFSPC
jgi:hypothetical protein